MNLGMKSCQSSDCPPRLFWGLPITVWIKDMLYVCSCNVYYPTAIIKCIYELLILFVDPPPLKCSPMHSECDHFDI